ncbi:MAG: DUF1653 domain-containing protein [bacterium]
MSGDILLSLTDKSAIPVGVYRHYKGSLYEVFGTARHSETEEILVLYRTLYGQREFWVRPLAMFVETVDVDGISLPRFDRVEAQTE